MSLYHGCPLRGIPLYFIFYINFVGAKCFDLYNRNNEPYGTPRSLNCFQLYYLQATEIKRGRGDEAMSVVRGIARYSCTLTSL